MHIKRHYAAVAGGAVSAPSLQAGYPEPFDLSSAKRDSRPHASRERRDGRHAADAGGTRALIAA